MKVNTYVFFNNIAKTANEYIFSNYNILHTDFKTFMLEKKIVND